MIGPMEWSTKAEKNFGDAVLVRIARGDTASAGARGGRPLRRSVDAPLMPWEATGGAAEPTYTAIFSRAAAARPVTYAPKPELLGRAGRADRQPEANEILKLVLGIGEPLVGRLCSSTRSRSVRDHTHRRRGREEAGAEPTT